MGKEYFETKVSFLDKKKRTVKHPQIKVPKLIHSLKSLEDSIILVDDSQNDVSELYDDHEIVNIKTRD